MTTITSQQVAEFMRAKLAEVHAVHKYGHITINHNGYETTGNEPEFQLWVGGHHPHCKGNSFEECADSLAASMGGRTEREIKLARAESLRKQADELEAEAHGVKLVPVEAATL